MVVVYIESDSLTPLFRGGFRRSFRRGTFRRRWVGPLFLFNKHYVGFILNNGLILYVETQLNQGS